MQLWFSNHAILLHRVAEITDGWLERRREDIDAARQSMDEIEASKSWSETLRTQQKFFLGSLRRLASDLSDLGSMALTLSGLATWVVRYLDTAINREVCSRPHANA